MQLRACITAKHSLTSMHDFPALGVVFSIASFGFASFKKALKNAPYDFSVFLGISRPFLADFSVVRVLIFFEICTQTTNSLAQPQKHF